MRAKLGQSMADSWLTAVKPDSRAGNVFFCQQRVQR
ncbi:Uncharacterised protein [Serratia quinivorans]|nr:Uncharacterised protein [Serratia quinivorans]